MTEARSRPTPQQGGSQDQHRGDGTSTDVDVPAPYARAWEIYADAGWLGVLPIARTWKGQPTDGKFPPPAGFTGRRNAGVYPDRELMQTWASLPEHYGNIALRAPEYVIGLDCDAYAGKHGDLTMVECWEKWGELPPTWRSSSRDLDDGPENTWPSGIYWFRVPSGLTWPGKLPGGDVEIISHGYRYAIVWPSIHPSGRVYRWWNLADDYEPDEPADRVPSPSDFPELPASWVVGLTEGEMRDDSQGQTPAVDMGEAEGWLTEGKPCQAMAKILDQYSGHRADVMRLQVKILRHGEQGHRGARAAWGRLRERYIADCDRDGAEEWDDLAGGAVKMIRSRTPDDQRRCCLMPALTLDQIRARRGGRS